MITYEEFLEDPTKMFDLNMKTNNDESNEVAGDLFLRFIDTTGYGENNDSRTNTATNFESLSSKDQTMRLLQRVMRQPKTVPSDLFN